MTADAKIGLLLGLVFIFIIAFIINGLPGFYSHPNTANATPAVAKAPDNPGVAGTAQDAQKKLDWQKELDAVTTPLTASSNTTPVAETPLTTTPTVAKETAGSSPTPAAELLAPSTPQTSLDASIQKLIDTPKAAEVATSAVQTIAELIDTSVSQDKTASTTPASATPTSSTPAVAKNDSTPTPAASVKKETPKEYVVQDGDDLGTIAKKVYGTVGKNPDLIYAYNKGTLKSKDVITPGQKLRIPPLPTTTAKSSTPKPAGVLPSSHFAPVSSVGGSQPVVTKAVEISSSTKSAGTNPTATQTEGRSYVVREGDSLWKIAASQLGNGARLREIVKLNAKTITNEDNVPVGTRLKLPAK